MTTVSTDMGGIQIAWNRIQHIIKYLDKPTICSGTERRGVLVATLPRSRESAEEVDLVFTRKGVELWLSTWIERPDGYYGEGSYRCKERISRLLVSDSIPGRAIEKFVLQGGEEIDVLLGIARAIERAIKDKKEAVASLELTLKQLE